MKSILLASASVFAFAGMASADAHTGVSFSGSASLGYNDDASNGEDGFYWDADIAVSMSMELDNGVTAAASFNFEAADDDGAGNLGQDLVATDYVLSLTHEMAGLYFGDTGPAPDSMWASAGDMEADGFSANDGDETYIRGTVSYMGIDAAVSYAVDDEDADADGNQLEQLGVAVGGDFGGFNFVVAYQEEEAGGSPGGDADFNGDEIFGVSVGTSFGGADLTVAYASNETAGLTSTGVKVAYPFGPVTVTAYYVMEDADAGDPDDNFGVNVAYADGPLSVTLDYQDDQGNTILAVDGSYDVGNGLTVLAGFATEDAVADDEFYIAGEVDLGGGASLLVAFAEGDDEIGSPEYESGTTVELSLDF